MGVYGCYTYPPMDLISLVFIALSLSADCFAVSICGSACLRRPSRLQILRTALAFGFAQFIMPVIGWIAGRTIVNMISEYDHWVAFALLALVGGRMIWESRSRDGQSDNTDITRGVTLLTLAIATSIDALAVGLSFALLDTGIIQAGLIIGVIAFGITVFGFWLGSRAGELLGSRAKLVGGLVLIGIGARILLTHLYSI
jgi:manganese efflux pump family protein